MLTRIFVRFTSTKQHKPSDFYPIPTCLGWFLSLRRIRHSPASIKFLNQELRRAFNSREPRLEIQQYILNWGQENAGLVDKLSYEKQQTIPVSGGGIFEDIIHQIEELEETSKHGVKNWGKRNCEIRIKFDDLGSVISVPDLTMYHVKNYYLHKHVNEFEGNWQEKVTSVDLQWENLDVVEKDRVKHEYGELLLSGYDMVSGLKAPLNNDRLKDDTLDNIQLGYNYQGDLIIHGDIPLNKVKKYFIEKRLLESESKEVERFTNEWNYLPQPKREQVREEFHTVLTTGKYIHNGNIFLINLKNNNLVITFDKNDKPIVSGQPDAHETSKYFHAKRYEELEEKPSLERSKQLDEEWKQLTHELYLKYIEEYQQVLCDGYIVSRNKIVELTPEHMLKQKVEGQKIARNLQGDIHIVKKPSLVDTRKFYYAWKLRDILTATEKVKAKKVLSQQWFTFTRAEKENWKEKYCETLEKGYDVVNGEIVNIVDSI